VSGGEPFASLEPPVLRRVGELLGSSIQRSETLQENRWIVARCTIGAGTVIVKQVRTRRFDFANGVPEGHVARFASERGALEFFAGDDELAAHVPRLLASDEEFGLVVLEDLGTIPTLAHLVLGDDPRRARTALFEYARLLGRFARQSMPRVDAFTAPKAHAEHFALEQTRASFDDLELPDGARDEMSTALDLLTRDTRWFTVGPADACPDNVLVAPERMYLLDFEGAARYHAVLDAGSLAIPFPSCWCHDAFSPGLRDDLVAVHRDALGRPAAAYDAALAASTITWNTWTIQRWLPGARRAEFSMPTAGLATIRQRVRAAAQDLAAGTAPALATWAAALEADLAAAWGPETARRPAYPAIS
jgi:hypothetical protein